MASSTLLSATSHPVAGEIVVCEQYDLEVVLSPNHDLVVNGSPEEFAPQLQDYDSRDPICQFLAERGHMWISPDHGIVKIIPKGSTIVENSEQEVSAAFPIEHVQSDALSESESELPPSSPVNHQTIHETTGSQDYRSTQAAEEAAEQFTVGIVGNPSAPAHIAEPILGCDLEPQPQPLTQSGSSNVTVAEGISGTQVADSQTSLRTSLGNTQRPTQGNSNLSYNPATVADSDVFSGFFNDDNAQQPAAYVSPYAPSLRRRQRVAAQHIPVVNTATINKSRMAGVPDIAADPYINGGLFHEAFQLSSDASATHRIEAGRVAAILAKVAKRKAGPTAQMIEEVQRDSKRLSKGEKALRKSRAKAPSAPSTVASPSAAQQSNKRKRAAPEPTPLGAFDSHNTTSRGIQQRPAKRARKSGVKPASSLPLAHIPEQADSTPAHNSGNSLPTILPQNNSASAQLYGYPPSEPHYALPETLPDGYGSEARMMAYLNGTNDYGTYPPYNAPGSSASQHQPPHAPFVTSQPSQQPEQNASNPNMPLMEIDPEGQPYIVRECIRYAARAAAERGRIYRVSDLGYVKSLV